MTTNPSSPKDTGVPASPSGLRPDGLSQSSLRPCPFCGAPALVELVRRQRSWMVRCSRACDVNKYGKTKLLAVAAWNCRVGERGGPAFTILADLHDAIVLTVEHREYALISDLANHANEFRRASEFLRAASAMSAQRAETQSGSGLQPASAVDAEGSETPKGHNR